MSNGNVTNVMTLLAHHTQWDSPLNQTRLNYLRQSVRKVNSQICQILKKISFHRTRYVQYLQKTTNRSSAPGRYFQRVQFSQKKNSPSQHWNYLPFYCKLCLKLLKFSSPTFHHWRRKYRIYWTSNTRRSHFCYSNLRFHHNTTYSLVS